IVLLVQLDNLAGGLVLELLEIHLKAAHRHGEFRTQQVLVGLYFLHRLRQACLQTACRQSYGAVVNKGHHGQPDQSPNQKSYPYEHQRFDHYSATATSAVRFPKAGVSAIRLGSVVIGLGSRRADAARPKYRMRTHPTPRLPK